MKLQKINHEYFDTMYEASFKGLNKDWKFVETRITAILDNNCVRFTVIENGKAIRKRYFKNNQKEKCLVEANKVLEKLINLNK